MAHLVDDNAFNVLRLEFVQSSASLAAEGLERCNRDVRVSRSSVFRSLLDLDVPIRVSFRNRGVRLLRELNRVDNDKDAVREFLRVRVFQRR